MRQIYRLLVAVVLLMGGHLVAQTYQLPGDLKLPRHFSLDQALNQERADLSTATVRRPLKADFFTYDSLAQDWELASKYEYDYTSEGWQSEEIEKDPVSGENFQRKTTSYDSEGEVTLELTKIWDGTDWMPVFRESFQFDQHGNQTEYLHEVDNSGSWEITSGERYAYTYDSEGRMTQKVTTGYNVSNSTWDNMHKETFSNFAGDNPTLLITQEWAGSWINSNKQEVAVDSNNMPTASTDFDWDGGQWQAAYREYDYVWFDFEMEMPQSYKTEYYSDSLQGWVQEFHVTAQYATNGSFTMLMASWNDSLGNYTPFMRITNTMDNYGNNTELKVEMQLGIWFPIMQIVTDYVYAANGDMLEMAVSQFEPMQFGLVPSYKFVYSDFAEIGAPSGLENPAPFARIFPTVTSGTVHVAYTATTGPLRYEVLDLTGRSLMTGTCDQSIDISAIPAQLVLLKLTDQANNTMVERIVKQ